MSDQPLRPTALTVQPENIPAELKALMTWCCWRYELGKRGKWTKVPYTPFTTSRAAVNRVSSLRSFQAAYNCYMERRDFFDGIFVCLSADDPYAGGDFDHSTDQARVPQTYAELSPSGEGIRFIGRGSIPSACKKPNGELYDRKRFLSITGHVLEGSPREIRPIQPELDRLYEELKGSIRTPRAGATGNGTRADRAAAIPDDVWQAGRHERRTNINRLLARLRASATSSKTGKRDTQLAYLLKEDYRGFHERWPYVGIVRGDDSLDSSQIRAAMASSIKSRNFAFPEFAALMSYFFGAECVAKWGNPQGVREEFATLWFIGRSPRTDDVQWTPEPAGRGRASDHSELLDRAYLALQDFKVGIDAVIKTEDWAAEVGVTRRTAITLLQELVAAGRITYRRIAYGLLIQFSSDVIYSQNGTGEIEHTDAANDHRPKETISASKEVVNFTSDVIYSENTIGDAPHTNGTNTASNDAPMSADDEQQTDVIYSPVESHDTPLADAKTEKDDERENSALSYIESSTSNTVLLPGTITSQKRVTLEAAIVEAYECLPRDRTNESTGERKRWPVTATRLREYLEEHYADQGWKPSAVKFWINKIRKRRRSEPFRELEKLKRETLEKKAAATRKRIEAAEHRATTHESPEAREWYGKQAGRLQGQLALLGWEQQRRETADNARLAARGYTVGEQQEFLELVERERGKHAGIRASPAPIPRIDGSGLIERLRARKEQQQ